MAVHELISWPDVYANAIGTVLASSIEAMVLMPTRRFWTVEGRRNAQQQRIANQLSASISSAAETIGQQTRTLHSVIKAEERTSNGLEKQLGDYLASAPFASLVRQGVALALDDDHQVDQPSNVKARLRGTLMISLRTSAPAVYATGSPIAEQLLDLLALAITDALEGLSPTYGAEAWIAAIKEQRQWQLESIEQSLRLMSQSDLRVDDFNTFPERYRSAIRQYFSTIPTPHWDGQPRVPIDRAYIPPQFVNLRASGVLQGRHEAIEVHDEGLVVRWSRDTRSNEMIQTDEDYVLGSIFRELAMTRATLGLGSDAEYPIEAPFADRLQTRCVVIGDPGAGKTAYASSIMHALAGGATIVGGCERLPFLVTLREYRNYLERPGGSGFSLTEYIVSRCAEIFQVRPPLGAVEFALLSGNALVIFDGLDEILSQRDRSEMISRIEVFSQLYPNSGVLVTSRRSGYDKAYLDPEMFETFSILPFNDAEVVNYVRSWLKLDDSMPPGERKEQQFVLSEAIKNLDRRLSTNPLTLALLCNLSKASGFQPLPRSRAELYEKCSLYLYHQHDFRRGLSGEDFERDHLPCIAYAADRILNDVELVAGFTEAKLVRLYVDFLVPEKFDEVSEAQRYARTLVEHCIGRAWVFSAIASDSAGNDLFNFTHRTFLEYFAALHLVRKHAPAGSLANELLPWIIAGERAVVCQMAYEIKSRQLDGASEEFYAQVLDTFDALASEERAAALMWLAIEASVVPLGQPMLRRLIRAAVEEDAAVRDRVVDALSAAGSETRRVVAQEVERFSD